MQSKNNKQLIPFAKQLHREMTKEESHLWNDFRHTYSLMRLYNNPSVSLLG